MNAPETSEDALLGGRVRLTQPVAGYRVAIDPVLLAAAVSPRPGERVLDAGTGVGAAALCLASRIEDVSVCGVEKQEVLAALFEENIVANAVGGRVEAWAEDLRDHRNGPYDHVMTNPPYLSAAAARASDDPIKRAATVEADLDLVQWLSLCLDRLRPKGTLTLIHRADRLAGIMTALAGRAGDIRLFPLWPRAGEEARRVVVRARVGVATPGRVLPGLVLHGGANRYTPEAEAVLRDGRPLPMGD